MAEKLLPDPPLTPESEPFYAAARHGRFLLRRCRDCGRSHWYPRTLCPHCFGETAWEDAARQGTIYSYSVMRRTSPTYAIAYVTLAGGGPTLLSNIVDCDFDRLAVGQPVRLVFKPSENGTSVPCFAPDDGRPETE